MAIGLKLEGRSVADRRFFEKSGLYWPNRNAKLAWTHYPVLAFVVDENQGEVRMRIFDSASALTHLPDFIQCLQVWPGQERSDYFKFTVGDARPYLPGTQATGKD